MLDQTNIATDSEIVEQCTENLTTVIGDFVMKEVDIDACDYIQAETNCDFTYKKGIRVTSQYANILEELLENMKLIHSIIDNTDQNIANSIR